MANLIQFDIQSEWTRLFTDYSFSKYQLTEEVSYKIYDATSKKWVIQPTTYKIYDETTEIETTVTVPNPCSFSEWINLNKATSDTGKPPLLDSVVGEYTSGNVALTKIASKNITFENYVDQYGNNQVKITEYIPKRCKDRDYRVVGIILNNTNHAECNEPWTKLPSGMEPNPITYDCENGWLECIADPDRWFNKQFFSGINDAQQVMVDMGDNTEKPFIRYETYNNNMTPMYYVLGVGPMMNNSTTLDKTNFRDYWCNNKICLFIYTIESNVGPLSQLVKSPYEFIEFYNKSDVDFITNGTLPQLTNYINDYYEIKTVTINGSTNYIQNKGNTFIKPSNIVSNSVFGPFMIKRIGHNSKNLNYYKKDETTGEYPDPKTISILNSSTNNSSPAGARFSKKFGSRNNTEVEVLSGSNSEAQFEIEDYSVYITSYYDFSVNNPYIRFGEGITEVYCEIEEDIKLQASSLYKYANQNYTIDTFISVNKENWEDSVGEDKASKIASFYNSFKWTKDTTPGSDKMLPPYNKETISNPKKHVPCRIVPVWEKIENENDESYAYNWILYCGSIEIVKRRLILSEGKIVIVIDVNATYKDKLYTNNGVKLNIETKTGYVIIDK